MFGDEFMLDYIKSIRTNQLYDLIYKYVKDLGFKTKLNSLTL